MSRSLGILLSTSFLATLPLVMPAMAAPEEIVVTATRTEQPVTRVGSAISVIDSVEIERRQYSFVRDAVAALPGVSISQNGPFGGFAAVRLRGLSHEQTLVLIDGVTANDPAAPGGGYDFSSLDPNDVDRIEVLRGPQSTLYGSDAMGGVVNIITKRGRAGTELRGFVEGGAHATFRGGATLSGAGERFDYRLSASGITTDGISKADRRDGNTEKDGYDNVTVSTNLGFQVVDGFRLEGSARYSDTSAETDSFGAVTGVVDGDEGAKSTELTLNTRAVVALYDGRFENIVSVNYYEIDRDSLVGGLPSFGAKGDRLTLSYQGNVHIAEGTVFTAGAETQESSILTDTDDASVTIDSVYAQLQVLLMEALTVTGGVRRDDHSDFGGHTTFRTTAAYVLEDTGTTFRASWGEGFKAPTPFQLVFFCCGATAPNPALRPEEARGWDAGIEQSLWQDRLRLGLTYFRQVTDNLIDFDFLTGGYININQARTRGVEASLDAELTNWLGVSANYTHTSAINRVTGSRLVRVPKDTVNVTVTATPTDRLTFSVGGQYNGKRPDSYGLVEDWVRVDLRAAYRLNDQIELYGRVENLFDKHYQELFGFGTPGISAHAGIRGRF